MSWRTNPTLNAIAGCILAGAVIVKLLPSDNDSTNGHSDSSKFTAHDIKSIEDAKKFVIGTWTYTGQAMSLGDTFWVKWVIKKDGTVDCYQALATDNDWGKPEPTTYKVFSSKYRDTGKRFYGITATNYFIATVVDDKLAQPGLSGTPMLFERGDKNPFSK